MKKIAVQRAAGWLAMGLGAVALAAMTGCSTTVSSYQASAENAALLPRSAASVAVGQFVLSSEGGGRRMMLRGVHRMESPIGEDFAAYLGESLRRELALAGKWDPKAPTEITGVLLKTSIAPSGLLTQTGEIEARFTVSHRGLPRYETVKRAELSWDASPINDVADTKAQQQYPVLVQDLIKQLFEDREFQAALK